MVAMVADCDEYAKAFLRSGWEDYGYELWVAQVEKKQREDAKKAAAACPVLVKKLSTGGKVKLAREKPAQAKVPV